MVDFSSDPGWHDIAYQEPSRAALARLAQWLHANPDALVRLYHGTRADFPVREQGLLPTGWGRRNSLQSHAGRVSLSIYPGHAEVFGQMAFPEKTVAVYTVELRVAELVPDLDQLRNQRLWGDRIVKNTLAHSLSASTKPRSRTRTASKRKRARKPARLTGAVILLASLFWEDDRPEDGPKGKERVEWRKAHLKRDKVADLRVPIRYGRKSGVNGRRKGQFTMVFAGAELGTAKVARLSARLPVKAGQISRKTAVKIGCEADALAEGIQEAGDTQHVAKWGVVAMGINPKSPHAAELRRIWRLIFKRDPKVEHWKFGRGIVGRGGFLRVRLPWSGDALAGVDFCLATQTDPLDPLPSPQAIAEAARPFGKNSYFNRTVAAGIITVDDEQIRRHQE